MTIAINYQSRRAELLAQLFLQELGAIEVASSDGSMPFDFLALFSDRNGGTRAVGVAVKSTERVPGGSFKLHWSGSTAKRRTDSNIPILILVIDVKRSRIFFNWSTRLTGSSRKQSATATREFRLPLREADAAGKDQLTNEILSLSAPKINSA